jgi:hypothetical protein
MRIKDRVTKFTVDVGIFSRNGATVFSKNAGESGSWGIYGTVFVIYPDK